MLISYWYLASAAASDPNVDLYQVALNNGAAVAILMLVLFTTKLRTGLNYDEMKDQMQARLDEKDEVIDKQAEMIRRFQEAAVVSSAAMAKSADVIEAIPNKEAVALDEVRSVLARLEQFIPPEGKK